MRNWITSQPSKLFAYLAVSFFGTIVGVGGQLVVDRMSWWEWVLFASAIGLNMATTYKSFTSGKVPEQPAMGPPIPR